MNIMQSFYDGLAGENRWMWTFLTPVIFGAICALFGSWRRLRSLEKWRLSQECPARPLFMPLMIAQVFFAALIFVVNLRATTLSDAFRQDNLGKLGLGLIGALFFVWAGYRLSELWFHMRAKV